MTYLPILHFILRLTLLHASLHILEIVLEHTFCDTQQIKALRLSILSVYYGAEKSVMQDCAMFKEFFALFSSFNPLLSPPQGTKEWCSAIL